MTYDLDIAAPPDVDLDAMYKDPIILRGGETLHIDIPYTGNPEPSVEWVFNNKPFKVNIILLEKNRESSALKPFEAKNKITINSYKTQVK